MNKGFTALISVLIVGALILVISIGAAVRSLNQGQMSTQNELSELVRSLAQACADDAVMKLKTTLTYAGNETITVQGSRTCDILPTEGSGNTNRTIKTQSTVSGYTAKVKVVVAQLRPTAQITSWEEVADF